MRFFLDSYGCTMNHGEGELFRRRLLSAGHTQALTSSKADVSLLFTCVVIQETESRMLKKVRDLSATGIPLVVSGCLVTTLPKRISSIAPQALQIPPRELAGMSIRELEMWLEGVGTIILGRAEHRTPPTDSDTGYYAAKEIFSGPTEDDGQERTTFIVPISQGCLGNCAYCLTKKARGNLVSYPIEDISDMVREAITSGRTEIQLTSQDTAIFGRDSGSSLPELLDSITSIDGEFRIRVGMMNPTGMLSILSDLIHSYASEKVYDFLHMPIQSGDDSILAAMRRGYSVDEVRTILSRFRQEVPELTLSTDIITGFPGESEESFEMTLDLIEELRPDIVNITRFSERPGTEAISLAGKVHGRISKERSRELTKLRFRISSEKNTALVGRRLQVLTTERGKGTSTICRDDSYRSVVIKEQLPLGIRYDVEIVDSTDVYLLGRRAE